MNCSQCPRWQGRTEWGDCNHVIGILMPEIYKMKTRFGWNFSTPFDPHDIKYFLEKIPKPKQLPEGVKIHQRKEKDIVFDDEGNERIKTVRLNIYRTHKDYYCGYEEM